MKRHRATPLLIVVLVALAGCAATDPASATVPSATPSATASETTAATPSPTASPSAEPAPDGLGPDWVASVVTSDLVVRTLPEISEASEILTPWLNEPTLLYVVDGPVAADGFEWYQVQPFGMHYLDDMQAAPPFGWVAAADKDGEPWIAPGSFECPDAADLDAIRSMTEIGRFACFEELTMEGQFDGCFVADPTVITPEWLIQTGCSLVPPGYIAGHVLPDPGGLQMRLSPELVMPNLSAGAMVRVVGRFDHPDAQTCEPVEGAGDEAGFVFEPMEPAEAVLLCRAQFVVTQIEEIGG